jgi:DNA processing protein
LDPNRLFEELQWDLGSAQNERVERKLLFKEENFSPEEWSVITALENAGGESLLDELSWRSQITVGQLANLLLQLEFKGLVRSLPGKRFRLEG